MVALRGSKVSGYRSDACECPSCGHRFALRGTAAQDKQGPYLDLYAVPLAPEQPALMQAPQQDPLAQYGIARPEEKWGGKRTTRMPKDPVPAFDGSDGDYELSQTAETATNTGLAAARRPRAGRQSQHLDLTTHAKEPR